MAATPGKTTAGTFLGREPVLWAAAIRAALYAAVLYGANLSEAQILGTMLAIEAILALVTRSQATPNAAVVERESDGVVYAGAKNDQVPAGAVVRRIGESSAEAHPPQTDEE